MDPIDDEIYVGLKFQGLPLDVQALGERKKMREAESPEEFMDALVESRENPGNAGSVYVSARIGVYETRAKGAKEEGYKYELAAVEGDGKDIKFDLEGIGVPPVTIEEVKIIVDENALIIDLGQNFWISLGGNSAWNFLEAMTRFVTERLGKQCIQEGLQPPSK